MALTDEQQQRRETLLAELAELEENAQEATEEAVDTAHESVSDTAEAAVEAAQEAADDVTEAVQEAAQEVADDTGLDVDHVYAQILARLESEGRLVAQVSEHAGDAPAELAEEVPVPDAVVEVHHTDEIAPRSEHAWYRKRRILGREI